MKKNFRLLKILFMVMVLLCARPVFAIESFSDFDSYKNGDLNGQDGWSDCWNPLLVQDEVKFENKKTVKNQTEFGSVMYKELGEDYLENGVASIKVRIDYNTFSDNQDIFGIYKGIGEEFIALIRFGNQFDAHENSLLLSKGSSTDTLHLGQITQGQWHDIAIGWRQADYSIRIKIDENDWSEWMEAGDGWLDEKPFGVRLMTPLSKDYGDFYFADLNAYVGNEILPSIPDVIESGIVPLEDPAPTILETATEVVGNIIETVVEFVLDVVGLGDTPADSVPVTETPVSESATEPIGDTIEVVPEVLIPISGTTTESVVDSVVETVQDPITEPISEPVVEPVIEPKIEPVVEPVIQEDADGTTTIIAI